MRLLVLLALCACAEDQPRARHPPLECTSWSTKLRALGPISMAGESYRMARGMDPPGTTPNFEKWQTMHPALRSVIDQCVPTGARGTCQELLGATPKDSFNGIIIDKIANALDGKGGCD